MTFSREFDSCIIKKILADLEKPALSMYKIENPPLLNLCKNRKKITQIAVFE